MKILFENLDDELKEQVRNVFPNAIEKKELMEELEKCKNGFIDWRYYFEKDFLKNDFCFLKVNFCFLSDF